MDAPAVDTARRGTRATCPCCTGVTTAPRARGARDEAQKRGMCGGSDGDPASPRRASKRAARKEGAWRRAIVASAAARASRQVAEDERAYVVRHPGWRRGIR